MKGFYIESFKKKQAAGEGLEGKDEACYCECGVSMSMSMSRL